MRKYGVVARISPFLVWFAQPLHRRGGSFDGLRPDVDIYMAALNGRAPYSARHGISCGVLAGTGDRILVLNKEERRLRKERFP